MTTKEKLEQFKSIKIKSLLEEIGGLYIHGHRNEGKWYSQEDKIGNYEEFKELESLFNEQQKLLELYKRLNKVQTRLSWYKIHTINSDKIEKYEREVFDITKQIKELENEKE